MKRTVLRFRGLGDLGAFIPEVQASGMVMNQSLVPSAPEPKIALTPSQVTVNAPVATVIGEVDQKWLAEQAAKKAAAAEAEAAAAKAELAQAKADFERIQAERAAGNKGPVLTPWDLELARMEKEQAERRAQSAQAMLEEVSVGARIGSAIKWAALPLGAGVIMLALGPNKGFKVAGGGALVVGLGLGVFRFLKKSEPDQYGEET